jgi:photosystem II stability/assembly factor-like uncharacterized protein
MERLGAALGWAMTDEALLVTRDGGATWTDATPPRSGRDLADVLFLDEGHAFAVVLQTLDDGRRAALAVHETFDAGRTWTETAAGVGTLDAPLAYAGAKLAAAEGQRLFLMGRLATSANWSRATLLRSDDGGASWLKLPEPPAAGELAFASAQAGFLVGGPADDRLLATRDGGASWDELALPGLPGKGESVRFAAPRFRSGAEGSLAATVRGSRPRLLALATSDGGHTWAVQDERPLAAIEAESLTAVALDSAGRVLARGTPGSVVLGTARDGLAAQSLGSGSAVRALSFGDDGEGWALVAEDACDASDCRHLTRVAAVAGGKGPRTLLQRVWSEPVPGGPRLAGSLISTALGFDTCEAPSVGLMQAWKTSSPFLDVNIYFGGSARYCNNFGLTASWVSQIFGQGWRIIPTWAGPQPCRTGGIPTDTALAAAQGRAQADLAVNAAAALGLGANSPIYYDFEAYVPTAACSPGVRSFVGGWTTQVRARGYLAGIYGTASNLSSDVVPSVVSPAPDAVWVAAWGSCGTGAPTCPGVPSVLNLAPLPNTVYASNQRIHQYWGGHTESHGGLAYNIDRNIAGGPVAVAGGTAPSCPFSSLQTRVQANASTPWAQSITITQGQSFTVGTFKNGLGQLTDCCTSISVSGPGGFLANPGNLGVITPPAAGTYTVRGTCGSLAQSATVTVTGAASCPFSSVQARVQQNASQPWSPAITITQGQSFTVGAFKNGWGVLTDCCTAIAVTGPNGFSATPSNLGVVTPPTPGTYTLRVTCGGLTETATVTVTGSSCPFTSVQARVQQNASQPWSPAITITQGQSFTVGAFKNGWGVLTDCCTSITVTGPGGFSASPANLGVVTPPAAGTYTLRVACGSLVQTATVTVTPPACPFASVQARVQPNASTPWAQSIAISQGQSFTVGAFKNGSGVLTDCCTSLTVTGPGFSATPANLGVVTPPAAGTYTLRVACGGLAETATVIVTPTVACPYGSLQSRVQRDASQPWSPSIAITLGQGFTVGAFQNGWGVLTDCCTSIAVTGPNGFAATPANLGVIQPAWRGLYSVRAACGGLSEVSTVNVQ